MKIEFTAYAHIDPRYESVDLIKRGKLPRLTLDAEDKYYQEHGLPCIGTATVTLELHDDKTVVSNQLAALGKHLTAVRAENQRQENAILDRMSKLQSITYEPA